MQRPTADDVRRDLAADLALCQAATKGPWTTRELTWDGIGPGGKPLPLFAPFVESEFFLPDEPYLRSRRGAVTPPDYGKEADNPYLAICRANAAFIAASRDGWEAAIRRAAHAEALLAEIVAAQVALLAAKGREPEPYHAQEFDRLTRALSAAREASQHGGGEHAG